ncbi:ejaculatory bulb-specific protein 3-like [Diprion similis]|uniref:ejaculatory bulb-specific protein 3-like n=1 Tax=Diprion similis TaxID=362088 RepID=UPI001EF9B4E7|nr:ejaculatory bulb-specific protein 3-like [Diprion similis]
MKCYCVMVLACIAAVAAADEYYNGKWNNLDTHAIVNNNRLLKKYEECVVEEKATGCPQDALELKKVLPEALETSCAKCSPEQKDKIKDTLGYLCMKQRASFDRLLAKFDPDQKYRAAFEEKFGKLEGCT